MDLTFIKMIFNDCVVIIKHFFNVFSDMMFHVKLFPIIKLHLSKEMFLKLKLSEPQNTYQIITSLA